ncbi:cytoplasmic phosphatidylinositol transfer protein 1 [Biomphalaria pfeifferi]|uniref:Cytoplasmic phosphatidylinositol transfer protein 1 n=1 Tax=Biomphalaria pfeifferi TaxID=112525 RepID=A0AAD8F2Z9_BIOPF|nr:cytoplasmic phosphatidylinositol transfer protein 1 [Biomphalaria pfeifferi]
MLIKEYRICMPLTVEEYRIGQLYMIAKHSHEQSEKGEGVEIVKNEVCHDPVRGVGQYTEKRIHLSNHLPSWIRALIPKVFYITEKAWNYYPYTITEYTCSFLPRFNIYIETRYEDNAGISENCLQLSREELDKREIDFVDIVLDPLPAKHYKESEDLTRFKSIKTDRGPLQKNWASDSSPVMCSYKCVKVKFEVFGLQGKVESFTHKAVRDILLLGHRQAFAWVDEWIEMSMEDLRNYEMHTNEATNKKVMES